MKLEPVTYYRLARDADGRPDHNSHTQRLFTMALRWHPEIDDAGATALHRLRAGDEIAERHLGAGVAYLRTAIVYYHAAEFEPYPGRDQEAINDLSALLNELEAS